MGPSHDAIGFDHYQPAHERQNQEIREIRYSTFKNLPVSISKSQEPNSVVLSSILVLQRVSERGSPNLFAFIASIQFR